MPVSLLVVSFAFSAVPQNPIAAPAADFDAAEALAYRAIAAVAAGEPGVVALQRAAARRVDLAAPSPAGYPGRARLSALLPRITAEYRHDERANRVVGLQSSGEVDYLRVTPGNAYLIRATWELSDLLAVPGELQAAEAVQARARRRAEAIARVTALHFERQRLRVGLLLSPPTDALERAKAELEIERLGAELDALTGGRLSGEAP